MNSSCATSSGTHTNCSIDFKSLAPQPLSLDFAFFVEAYTLPLPALEGQVGALILDNLFVCRFSLPSDSTVAIQLPSYAYSANFKTRKTPPRSTVTITTPHNMAEFHPQLSELVHSRNGTIPMENGMADKLNGETKDCLFLKKLPIELRNEIYKILLTNPDLSDIGKLQLHAIPQVRVDLCLSPSILATCRQIYEEGQVVLYGMNTFVWDARGEGHARCVSPVMRKWKLPPRVAPGYADIRSSADTPGTMLDYQQASEIRQIPAVAKAKNWKVIMPGRRAKDPNSKFTLFCRALCLNSPRTLEVLLTGVQSRLSVYGAKDDSSTATGANTSAAHSNFDASGVDLSNVFSEVRYPDGVSMEMFLRSLALLRNLKSFKLRTFETNTFDSEGLWSEFKSAPLNLSNERKAQIEATVTSDSPPELAFRIYDALVEYVQAFERYEPFKEHIRASYFDVVGNYGAVRVNTGLRLKSDREIQNPYAEEPKHPVEAGMMKANLLTTGQSKEPFLEERDAVLEYLEPQYQKITAGASATAEFIKRRKKTGLFFDPQVVGEIPYLGATDLAGAMIVLEDYAKAFERDVPPWTRKNIRAMQHEFDIHYSTMTREGLLKQMSGWMVSLARETLSVEKLNEFREAFKAAVDDMDSQYLEIRRARKALFDYDDARGSFAIDLELGLCDEKIDWSVCEPDTEPARDPQNFGGSRPWTGILGNW